MSNNEFLKYDSVFKNAAEDFELPFNEKAWDLLDKKLDAAQSKTSNKKGFGWLGFGVAAAIITVGSLVYFYNQDKNIAPINANDSTASSTTSSNNNVEKNNSTNETKVSTDEAVIAKSEAEAKTNEVLNKNSGSVDKNQNDEVVGLNKTNNNCSTTYIKLSKSENKNNQENIAASITKKAVVTTKNNTKEVQINSIKDNAIASVDKIKDDNKSKLNIPANASNSLNPSSNKTINTNSYNGNSSLTTSVLNNSSENAVTKATYSANQGHSKYIEDFENAETEAAKIPKPDLSIYEVKPWALTKEYPEVKVPSHWYLSASLGTNNTFLKNANFAHTRFAYNFNLGYSVNNHTSFQIGVGYSDRIFWADKRQFTYSGKPIGENVIMGASVDMKTLRIPIEVRYQFSEIPNKGLFFTAGFSKLIYLQDNTNMDVLNILNQREIINWESNKSSSDFNMFNFSLGYQYRLSNCLTLTAQQMLELPLDKYGTIGSRMISTGLQIGCKYGF